MAFEFLHTEENWKNIFKAFNLFQVSKRIVLSILWNDRDPKIQMRPQKDFEPIVQKLRARTSDQIKSQRNASRNS